MEETLEIKYLIKAVDQATATMQKIETQLGSMNKSIYETEKAQKSLQKQNKKFGLSFSQITQNVENTTSIIKRFYDLLVNFDFKKLIRGLTILGLLLKFKGMSSAGNAVLELAGKIDVMSTVVGKVNDRMEKLQETYGSFTGAILHGTGLDVLISKLGSIAVETLKFIGIWGGLGALFLGTIGTLFTAAAAIEVTATGIQILGYGISLITPGMDLFHIKMWNAARLMNGGLSNAFNSIIGLSKKIREAFLGMANSTLAVGATTKGLFATFGKALGTTEAFEKGIFGVTARLAVLGTGLVGIGRLLVSTDDKLLQISGISMLAFAAALGFTASIIRSFVISIGEFISSIGSKMVSAVQDSIKSMNKLNDSTYTFSFIIQRLNEETKGSTGSLQEWNETILVLSKNTGYATTEIQKSTSELLRVGNSLGLTKNQMKSMLPIIADLAAANHRDLFSSTLAVVEALGGQTVMLQNMGVSLTQHALSETKAGEAMGKRITKLSNSEKIQLRYNGLLEKTVVTQGLAAASLNTMEGVTRRMNTSMQNMNVAIGSGAEIIETFFNRNVVAMIELVSGLSDGVLKVGGFMTSLVGRILQVTGTFFQWSFAIVLVGSSLAALNVLLADKTIANYIIKLSKAQFITKTLAASMPALSNAISLSLAKIGTAGLGVTSVFGLLKVAITTTAAAAWEFLTPFIIAAGWIAVIVGAVYVLYLAFKKIDDQTKFFTKSWKSLVEWWDKSGILQQVNVWLLEVWDTIQKKMITAIFSLSKFLVLINVRWLTFQQNLVKSKQDLIAFGNFMLGWLKKAPSALLNLLGIQSAYADELSKTEKKAKGLISAEDKKINLIQKEIDGKNLLITNLEKARDAEIAAIDQVTQRRIASVNDHKKALQEGFDFEKSLAEAKKAIDLEETVTKGLGEELKNIKDLEIYAAFLNDKEILKLAYEARELENTKKHNESIQKLVELRNKLEEKRIKKDQGSLANFFSWKQIQDKQEVSWTKKSDLEKVKSYRDTANQIATLATAKNKTLAAIGKVAAVTTATIDWVLAVQKTLASVPYPFSVPLASAVGIAAAANVAKISGLATFREGGIVDGPKAGDQQIVRANGDEMFLTKGQQGRLFNMINKGGTGNNEDISEALNNLADSIRQRPVILEADGRELARVIRDQRLAGVQI